MELDPGSIGKGFAVDSVVALLRENEVHSAFISAGGSTLYGLGAPPDKAGWPVEVPDPRKPGKIATTFWLHDTSLSTGACTEKFFVLAPSATDSDALSTVVFVLPPEQSREVLRGLRDIEAILFLSAPGGPTCVVFGASNSICDARAPTTNKGAQP
jgi:thiamine biosynthesis lipoprotein